MNAKHQRAIGSLIIGTVIASVLASVGCADGQRQGSNSGKGRRMFRTQGNPTAVANKGAAGKTGAVGSTTVTTDSTGATTFEVNKESSALEKSIDDRVDKMTADASQKSALVAGQYTLDQTFSHAKISKNNVWARAFTSTSTTGEAKNEKLTSGLYDGAPAVRELRIANKITVDAGGNIVIAPGQEILLKSSVERNKTQIAIVESNPPLATVSAGVPSLAELVKSGSITVDGKTIKAVASTVEPGVILVWISIDEKVPGKTDVSGDVFVRNFFLVFTAPAAGGTDGAKGADGATINAPVAQ